MEPIKKTFKELNEIDALVAGIYAKTPTLKDGKFGYSHKKFYEKNFQPTLKEYQQALNDIRIDNALTDEKTKALLVTEKGRGFEYSKDGLKDVIKAEIKLENEWFAKTIEVEPYIIKPENLPELNDEQIEAFKGVLID